MLTTENLKCFSQYARNSLLLDNPCLLSPKQERTIAVNKKQKTRYFFSLSEIPLRPVVICDGLQYL